MAVLIVESTKQKIPLDQPALTIGSGDKSMVQIQDPKLGQLHCQIIKNGNAFRIISLDQATGTFINGIKVKDQQLKGGDVIQLGATKLLFQEDGQNAAPKPTTTVTRPTTQGIAKPATQTGIQRPPSGPVRQPTQPMARPATKAIPTGVRPATQPVPTGARPPSGVVKQPTQGIPRPGTQAVPVPRPGTQAVPRPGTQPVRSPTQAIQKPSTQAQKTVTQRGKPGGRPSGRQSKLMTQAKINMRKKKIPRGLLIFGTTALILGGLVAIIVMMPNVDKELEVFSLKTGAMSNEAVKATDEKRYDDAIKIYDQILAICGQLSSDAKEKSGDIVAVYKGKKMEVQKRKDAGGSQAKKVGIFIGEAEKLLAEFKVDEVAPFLFKNEWVQKATEGDAQKAKDLYTQLQKKRDEEIAKNKPWSAAQPDFDLLLKSNDYLKAKEYLASYVANCKDAQEIQKAKKAEEQLLPSARDYTKTVRKNFRAMITAGKKPDDIRPDFDKEVATKLKGILPDPEIEEMWGKIIKD